MSSDACKECKKCPKSKIFGTVTKQEKEDCVKNCRICYENDVNTYHYTREEIKNFGIKLGKSEVDLNIENKECPDKIKNKQIKDKISGGMRKQFEAVRKYKEKESERACRQEERLPTRYEKAEEVLISGTKKMGSLMSSAQNLAGKAARNTYGVFTARRKENLVEEKKPSQIIQGEDLVINHYCHDFDKKCKSKLWSTFNETIECNEAAKKCATSLGNMSNKSVKVREKIEKADKKSKEMDWKLNNKYKEKYKDYVMQRMRKKYFSPVTRPVSPVTRPERPPPSPPPKNPFDPKN